MSKVPPTAASPITAPEGQDDANLDAVNPPDADIGEPALNIAENPLEAADARVPEVAFIDSKEPNNESATTDSDRSPLAKDIPPDLIADECTNRDIDQSYHQHCLAAFRKAEQHRQAIAEVAKEEETIWTALGELERVDRAQHGLQAYPLNAMTGNEVEEIEMDQENGIGLAGMAQGDLRRHCCLAHVPGPI